MSLGHQGIDSHIEIKPQIIQKEAHPAKREQPSKDLVKKQVNKSTFLSPHHNHHKDSAHEDLHSANSERKQKLADQVVPLLDVLSDNIATIIRIPLQNQPAPIHLNFEYFRQKNKPVSAQNTDLIAYLSLVDEHPDKEFIKWDAIQQRNKKNNVIDDSEPTVMRKRQPKGEISFGMKTRGQRFKSEFLYIALTSQTGHFKVALKPRFYVQQHSKHCKKDHSHDEDHDHHDDHLHGDRKAPKARALSVSAASTASQSLTQFSKNKSGLISYRNKKRMIEAEIQTILMDPWYQSTLIQKQQAIQREIRAKSYKELPVPTVD